MHELVPQGGEGSGDDHQVGVEVVEPPHVEAGGRRGPAPLVQASARDHHDQRPRRGEADAGRHLGQRPLEDLQVGLLGGRHCRIVAEPQAAGAGEVVLPPVPVIVGCLGLSPAAAGNSRPEGGDEEDQEAGRVTGRRHGWRSYHRPPAESSADQACSRSRACRRSRPRRAPAGQSNSPSHGPPARLDCRLPRLARLPPLAEAPGIAAGHEPAADRPAKRERI